tara:strand:+ start:856 stop:1674 length:819 start_codon:yes stop_codon:yes gene_type:complete
MKKLKILINNLNFLVNQEGHEFYWDKVNRGKWEPNTFSVFDTNINNQTLFIDVGGWIGPTSLYGSQLAKKTLTLEPDPVAYIRLKENLNLNTFLKNKLKLFNVALWHKETSISLAPSDKFGDSTSSVLKVNKVYEKNISTNKSFSVKTMTFRKLLKHIDLKEYQKVFVKIDIEGAEYFLFDFLLKNLLEVQASFLVSTHPWLLGEKSKIGVFQRINQAVKHWQFCQKIKKHKFKLVTSNKGFSYIPIINSIGWILIGKMHQDILAIPSRINK